MALQHSLGAVGLGRRIDPKDITAHLRLGGTFRTGMQQAQVDGHMRLVIGSEGIGGGGVTRK